MYYPDSKILNFDHQVTNLFSNVSCDLFSPCYLTRGLMYCIYKFVLLIFLRQNNLSRFLTTAFHLSLKSFNCNYLELHMKTSRGSLKIVGGGHEIEINAGNKTVSSR